MGTSGPESPRLLGRLLRASLTGSLIQVRLFYESPVSQSDFRAFLSDSRGGIILLAEVIPLLISEVLIQ